MVSLEEALQREVADRKKQSDEVVGVPVAKAGSRPPSASRYSPIGTGVAQLDNDSKPKSKRYDTPRGGRPPLSPSSPPSPAPKAAPLSDELALLQSELKQDVRQLDTAYVLDVIFDSKPPSSPKPKALNTLSYSRSSSEQK
jgi:hypothetical protein